MRLNLYYIVGVGIAIAAIITFSSIIGSTVMEEHAVKIEEAVMAEEWERAQDMYQELVAEWKRRQPWAEVTNSVNLTHEIDRLLARLGAAIRTEERGEAVGLLADLNELWYEVRR